MLVMVRWAARRGPLQWPDHIASPLHACLAPAHPVPPSRRHPGRGADTVRPYRIEVVQGNFVSKEQVEALQKGMTRQQVREVLGTPLVTSLFHANRWDYVFTLKRQGVPPQSRHLAVFFQDDKLASWEGDTMPSESEFVAALDKHKGSGKVPPLVATEEQLRAASTKSPAAPAAAASAPAAATPAAPANYPPLEATTR
jgi:outer membrane protein assembly factor BamE